MFLQYRQTHFLRSLTTLLYVSCMFSYIDSFLKDQKTLKKKGFCLYVKLYLFRNATKWISGWPQYSYFGKTLYIDKRVSSSYLYLLLIKKRWIIFFYFLEFCTSQIEYGIFNIWYRLKIKKRLPSLIMSHVLYKYFIFLSCAFTL